MATAFIAGPRLSDPPRGDPAGRAIASLRGYAYQLYSTSLAWLDLREGEELYLEVAKDYAVAAGEALRTVEVKDTARKVTIHSQDVRDTIDHFVDLVARNPERLVTLHFLSTCTIGRERKVIDRINDKAVLEYWRKAAAGDDLKPLRHVLTRVTLTERARAFIDARDDDGLRRDLLRRLHWDCGQPGLDAVKNELEVGLIRYGSEHLSLMAAESAPLRATILERVLTTAVGPEPRRLTRADLRTAMENASGIVVQPGDLRALMNKLAQQPGKNGDAPALQAIEQTLLEPEGEFPLPPLLSRRREPVGTMLECLRALGFIVATGGKGLGKTLLARLVARSHGGKWYVLDLRDASPEETSERLQQALRVVGSAAPAGLILDDLNEIEDPTVRRNLARLLLALKRRDALCISTAYREPSTRACTDLGMERSSHVPVPDLTEQEVGELVTAAGGDAAHWARPVFIAGAFGHPQLVQAVIAGLKSRSWPEAERRRPTGFDINRVDVEAERRAARQSLVAGLPENTKSLLYRISLLFGRFERRLVLAVGGALPPIGRPGEHLDALIGPWIDQVARDQFRLSPLLADAGHEILMATEQTEVHRISAETLMAGRQLDVSLANAAFQHALLGKAEYPLLKIANSIATADSKIRGMLSEWFTALRFQRADQPLYPDRPALSRMLRLAQFLLVTETGNVSAIRRCWNALDTEMRQEPDAKLREAFEFIVLGKALNAQPAVAALPNWIALILRFGELARTIPQGRRFVTAMKKPYRDRTPHSVVGVAFILQAFGIRSVAELGDVFDQLNALTHGQRKELFAEMIQMPSDFHLFVNHAWLEEHKRGNIDWLACAQAYQRMAAQAQAWGFRELALRCHVARGIMFDEYAEDPSRALTALDEAAATFGPDSVLSRARAKILWRRKDYAGALPLLREVADKTALNDPVERAFLLREGGISAAELGRWPEARQWFAGGRAAAAEAISPEMRSMAIGLRVDEAVAAFTASDHTSALREFVTAVEEVSSLDPESSIKAAYCHRVLRHAVLWVFGQATRRVLNVDKQPVLIPPGAASNPEPQDLTALPLGPLEIVWYLLAEAEIAVDASAAIETRLRERLGGRAIPSLEMALSKARLDRALRHYQADNFVKLLPPFVASQLYLVANREALMTQNVMQPVFGKIDEATAGQLSTTPAIFAAEDAAIAFGMAAALTGKPESLIELAARFEEIRGPDYPGARLCAIMTTGQTDSDRLEDAAAAEIHRVAHRTDLDPNELFVAGLRFVQAAKQSNFKRELEPLLEAWMRKRWRFVVENQRFFLRNPSLTAGAIEEALASSDTGLPFVGRLLSEA